MQQRKWVSMLAAGAMLSTMLAGCMENHGELGNRNIRGNSVKYDMNGNRILNTRFANDQMNEMNRVDGHRLNSNNLVGLHKNYRLEMSQSMSDRISNLDGVGDAHVMLTDDNAYVALSLKNNRHGTNAMSFYSPTTIGRTQQAYMRPNSMKSYNTHAYTKTNKSTRASSIATPNMRLKRSVSGAGIVRAKSLNAKPLHGKSMTAKSLHGKSVTARTTRIADGRSSSSFHNVSNGVRNMSLSMTTNHLLLRSKNMNGTTGVTHPNGMTRLSRDTSRGLTNLSRDMSMGRSNLNPTARTSNVGRDLYRGTANVGTDLARGTANVGTDIIRGTANVGSDIIRGTANVGTDILRGTANVGNDIVRGTGNVGTDLARGTGSVGTDLARGTTNVGRDILRGTANTGTDMARGTANVGNDILRGTANVGTNVARGTANAGTDVLRGTGNAGTDLARGTTNVGRDITRGVRNLSEDTADLLRGTTGLSRDVRRGTTSSIYGGGMTNLSRNTTDLTRTVTPYAANRSTAGSEVPTALKAEIDRLIKQMSPQIKNVYISADPEFMDRMSSYMADVKKGNTIQPYIAEFNAMVDRIFPMRART